MAPVKPVIKIHGPFALAWSDGTPALEGTTWFRAECWGSLFTASTRAEVEYQARDLFPDAGVLYFPPGARPR